MKKTLSILLAVLMMLALIPAAAFAEDATYTITIKDSTANHTYEAYQVFAGDLSGTTLSNIVWGTGVNGESLLAALKATSTFADCTSPADVAALLNDSNAKAFAKIVAEHLSTTTGTSTGSSSPYTISGLAAGYYLVKDKDSTAPDAYTDFVLKLVANVDVSAKMDVPTVEKGVKSAGETDYSDKTNASVGESVDFELTGTVPDMSAYNTYSYTFTDTLSTGLTYNNDAKVYFVPAEGNRTEITSSFAINFATTPATIACADIKSITGVVEGGTIVVEYTATLNENAVLASSANTNKVTLTYSNNPNSTGTGTTTEEEVKVYTYEFDLHKYDAADDEKDNLAGAEFELYKGSAATAIQFVVDANGVYKVATAAQIADEEVATTATIVTTDTGKINIEGLGAGSYTLKETKAPDGFNKLKDDVSFTIYASDDLTSSTLTEGEVVNTLEVANSSGATLPSTGGIGTTIFTVVGLVLMLGAAVVLVAKKRMSSK